MKEFIREFFTPKGDDALFAKEVDKASEKEVIAATIKKYRTQYLAILCLISLFEIIMMVRGLLLFNFESIRCKVYMCCYVILLVNSLVCIYFVLKNFNKEEIDTKTVSALYYYIILITVWSCAISVTDIIGGHTPIVFMSVTMGASALAFLNPKLYTVIVTILSGVIIYFIKTYNNSLLSSGYVLNLIIFVVFTVFIAFRKYQQNESDYVVTKKLQSLSYHDQLTNIKNRYALQIDLKNIDPNFCFGIFDIDNFKIINDTYGHDFGDACLKEIAYQLNVNFKDKAYRYGGDEFVVISYENQNVILSKCEAINNALKEKFPEKNIRVSAGFYFQKNSAETYEDYFRNADNALYKAKESRKGNISFYK